MQEALTWVGIVFCISQSALFSGMNLAVFSPSRLNLESAAAAGDRSARRVLHLRKDANFTLSTILWGNVGINVLLTLLADSLLAGIYAFCFSTILITFLGEICPQAYCARHAVLVASRLAWVLRVYRYVLLPVAWPSGKLLDLWVGREGIPWFGEKELGDLIRHHAHAGSPEVSHVEAIGAINFLALDDVLVGDEGEPIDPESVLQIPIRDGEPVLPSFSRSAGDPFLRRLESSGKKWVIFVDERGEPRFVMDFPAFLRHALFDRDEFDPLRACHHPLIIRDATQPLGRVLTRLTVRPEKPGDDVIDEDLILVWTPTTRRIITGSDLLGRLLRGIVRTG